MSFSLFKNALVSLITALQGLFVAQIPPATPTPTPTVQEVTQEEVAGGVAPSPTPSLSPATPKPTPDLISIVQELENLKQEIINAPEPTPQVIVVQVTPVPTPVVTPVAVPEPTPTPLPIKRVFMKPQLWTGPVWDGSTEYAIVFGWDYHSSNGGVGLKCVDQNGELRSPDWKHDYVFDGDTFLYSINYLTGEKDYKNILMHGVGVVKKNHTLTCHAFPYDENHTSEVITIK